MQTNPNKTKPVVIDFNGLGQPHPAHIVSGHAALLVQGDTKKVVRIEILPPEAYGPCLHHATNQNVLDPEIAEFWRTVDDRELTPDRHWIIDCPKSIAAKATFR